MTKERLFEKLDAEVERWNRDHPIGTRVDFGGLGITTTGTLAFIHESRACVRLSCPDVVADLAEVWPCS
jgi:hypothetical protein